MATSREHRLIRHMSAVGVFGALSFVLTAFCQIPYAGGAGYFNFGDLVNLLSSIVLGPFEGALVGILGGTFADLYSGFGIYAPWTMMAKGLMGLISGGLYIVLKNKRIWRFSSLFIGATFEILSYMICYYVLYGAGGMISSAFDCVQAYGSSALVIPLYLALEKSGITRRLDE